MANSPTPVLDALLQRYRQCRISQNIRIQERLGHAPSQNWVPASDLDQEANDLIVKSTTPHPQIHTAKNKGPKANNSAARTCSVPQPSTPQQSNDEVMVDVVPTEIPAKTRSKRRKINDSETRHDPPSYSFILELNVTLI